VSTRRSRLFPELANQSWTLWGRNEKCGPMAWSPRAVDGWLPIVAGMRHSVAVAELVERQNRVRKTQTPCVFKLLPDGETPISDHSLGEWSHSVRKHGRASV